MDGMKRSRSKALEYTAFLQANERGGYTVAVPALPGLVTDGKDLNHARCKARDTIQCYVGGLKKTKEPVPVERETAKLKISVVAQ
jgi:antitoxin HicB